MAAVLPPRLRARLPAGNAGFGREANANSGFIIVQGKPRLHYEQLTFARQLISLHSEISELPERDRLTPLLAAVPDTPQQFGALWLETPDTNDGKTLSGFTRRFQPLLEEKLRASGRLAGRCQPAAPAHLLPRQKPRADRQQRPAQQRHRPHGHPAHENAL